MSKSDDVSRYVEMFWLVSRGLSSIWKRNFEQRLSNTQSYILIKLDAEGPQKITVLAEALDITPGAISSISDKLIACGFATRSRDEEDRRVVYLEITPLGKEILREIQEESKAMINKVFNGLPEEDIHHLVRIYEKLIQNIEHCRREK
ncbi:MarR family winged helix-turn-helix transcriptional regulator [Paenibacillus sp. J2TS4]|uniref:MarR family winged helix-turn-helix transcriptional regulator n=1 Tax=Paenibacillus sp. J2TS4 TaxID=2807194 RepID=UPI001AFE561A|nr:MarR family transcriptional regulator [Paenibacillus sp. J2TS4]GIP32227.1 hypothetical protein J2TS4_14370 [Paenibacillus sp. J2TS4]